MHYVLDGEKMISVEITHHYLASQLDFPEYYGGNLDALWDLLSTVSEPMEIRLINKDKLVCYLDSYGDSLIDVFHEAAVFNENISFKIVK